MEREIPLKAVRVYKYCPKCPGTMNYIGSGGMISITQGSNLTTLNGTTTTFNHKCDKCSHYDSYTDHYPYIKYIETSE